MSEFEVGKDVKNVLPTQPNTLTRRVLIGGFLALAGAEIARRLGFFEKDPTTDILLGSAEISKSAYIRLSPHAVPDSRGDPGNKVDWTQIVELNGKKYNGQEKILISNALQLAKDWLKIRAKYTQLGIARDGDLFIRLNPEPEIYDSVHVDPGSRKLAVREKTLSGYIIDHYGEIGQDSINRVSFPQLQTVK